MMKQLTPLLCLCLLVGWQPGAGAASPIVRQPSVAADALADGARRATYFQVIGFGRFSAQGAETPDDPMPLFVPAAPPPFLWWYTTQALRVVLGLSLGFIGLTEVTDNADYIHLGGTVLAFVALALIPSAFVADSLFMFMQDRAVAALLFL